jgi:hypothetical protein
MAEDADAQVFVALYDVTPTDESPWTNGESAHIRPVPQGPGAGGHR